MKNKNGQNLFNILVVALAIITLSTFLFTRLLSPQLTSQIKSQHNQPIPKIDQQIINNIIAGTVAIQGRTYNNQSLICSSSGSGVFISDNGLILTNEHVITGCDLIYIVDHTGKTVKADVISSDKRLDIAILQIQSESQTPALPLGDTSLLEYGQPIIAAGNPYNTGSDGKAVVTFGRISRLNEKSQLSPDFANDRFYPNLIQFDASVFPGSSGGPLTDDKGNVVGIVTAVSNTNLSHPIGYAICLDDKTYDAIDTLIDGQTLAHGFLGTVLGDEIPFSVIEEYKLTNLSGAYVISVLPGSPAVQAGILPGDIIKKISNQTVNNRTDLISITNSHSPGNMVEIELIRPTINKKLSSHKVAAKLENRTLDNRNGYYQEANLPYSSAWGLVVKPISKWRRTKVSLPNNQTGVLVYQVDQNSMAFKQGIKPGDIITTINSQPIRNLADFELISSKSVFSPKFQTWQNDFQMSGN